MSEDGREIAALLARNAELEAEVAGAREQRRWLQSILEHAPDFLAHVTVDGRFLFLNRVLPGIAPFDVERATIYDFIPPAYHPVIRQAFARLVATKRPQAYETHGDGPNHELTPYFSRIAPVLDDAGEVQSVVMIATNVGRLTQTETALAESQAMLMHVLRASKMGTWWWDRARNVGGHDVALARIVGFDEANMPGYNLASVMGRVHPDDRERVATSLRAAYETGEYGPIDHRVVRSDGTVRWVEASARLVSHLSGDRLVGGCVDITERKRLEERLAQAQKMESIGRLAGGIAHDFNNMLTAILSYNHFAMAAAPPGSRLARDLGEVRRAAERSVALTGQLLAFARQQVITPEVADLDATVVRVLDLLRRVLGEDIEVVTLLDARQRVRIDVHQFEQVLVNLATNARDAMPQGGRLTITSADVVLAAHEVAEISQLEPGPYVMLAVADTGSGIAPEVLARVFEPFFTTKPQGQGTGLGLATCYGIVAQSRGHIIVDSAPGNGTTFRVYLPPATGELPAVVPAAAPARVTGTETVLVVEDEPSVRAVTVKALELAGFRVVSAANGSEAITLARDHAARIDLLLTDVVMPQMGGPRLAELLRAMRPDLAVLFVSGYTNDPGILQGEVEFLQKPFSPEVLAARVRQAIDRAPR